MEHYIAVFPMECGGLCKNGALKKTIRQGTILRPSVERPELLGKMIGGESLGDRLRHQHMLRGSPIVA
jgi:hypothetical protein